MRDAGGVQVARRTCASAPSPSLEPVSPPPIERPKTECSSAAFDQCVDALRYSNEPGRLEPGNSLELLIDGDEAFPAMLEAIESAREFVHLETYILADDAIGRRFARALGERARVGVSVRVMFDSVGSWALPASFVSGLAADGIRVVEFRPLSPFKAFALRGKWTRRDHRKMLVVDGRVGFTGGLNISREYASFGKEEPGWRDTHVKATGPVVAQLEDRFRRTWHRAGGAPYASHRPGPDRIVSARSGKGAALAAVVSSLGGRRSRIRDHYLYALAAARKTIFIANAYFLPDRGLLRALRRASRRGVRVVLVVPAESDVWIVQQASEHLYDRLMRSGIEVHPWPRTHMHAKTAVVDGAWSVVGSYNLDSVSLFQNLEVVIECVDREFGRRMNERFALDLESSAPLRLDPWRRRPLWRRLTEALAYQLQRWL
jgi:cardiolipin synthase A/B